MLLVSFGAPWMNSSLSKSSHCWRWLKDHQFMRAGFPIVETEILTLSDATPGSSFLCPQHGAVSLTSYEGSFWCLHLFMLFIVIFYTNINLSTYKEAQAPPKLSSIFREHLWISPNGDPKNHRWVTVHIRCPYHGVTSVDLSICHTQGSFNFSALEIMFQQLEPQ